MRMLESEKILPKGGIWITGIILWLPCGIVVTVRKAIGGLVTSPAKLRQLEAATKHFLKNKQ